MGDKDLSSAGHKLGQLIGNWYEEYFVLPLLEKVANHLNLFLDHRFRTRKARIGEKVNWKDEEENQVDYDATVKLNAAHELRHLVGEASLDSYVDRVRAALGALPQEIRFISQKQSQPAIFESIGDATAFLNTPAFDFSAATENCIYQITYSDGTEFERVVASIDELRTLHQQIERLAQHVSSLQKQNATSFSSLHPP